MRWGVACVRSRADWCVRDDDGMTMTMGSLTDVQIRQPRLFPGGKRSVSIKTIYLLQYHDDIYPIPRHPRHMSSSGVKWPHRVSRSNHMRSQPSPLMLHLLCQIGTSQSCCCCVRVSSRRSVHLFHFFFIAPVGQKPEIFSLSENAPATQHSSKRPGASSYARRIIAHQGGGYSILTATITVRTVRSQYAFMNPTSAFFCYYYN